MGSISVYQYSPLQEPDAIRLFQLSPSSSQDSDIHSSIIHTNLSKESNFTDSDTSHPPESPNYICGNIYVPSDAYSFEGGCTALSYTWGSPERICSVYIDGMLLPITANLDQALRSLRLEAKSPRLWVDSICINQESDQKRNHQVRQMCAIYKTATSTIIYLGPATALSTSCFAAAAAGIGTERAHFSNRELARGKDEILGRSWFTRAWTFQELVVSRRPWVCCGTMCVPWSQLCTYFLPKRRWNIDFGTEKWINSTIGAKNYVYDPWGLGNVVEARYSIVHGCDSQTLRITTKGFMIMDKVRQFYQAGPGKYIQQNDKFSLFTLLEHRQGFAASDPRDAAFSLYGVLDPNDKTILRTPVDYKKSIAQAFTDIAIELLFTGVSHVYALFTHVENGQNEIDGLPSWVPNWAAIRKYNQSIRNHIIEWTFPLCRLESACPKMDFRIYKEESAIDRWMSVNPWEAQIRIFAIGKDSIVITSGEKYGSGLREISTQSSWKNYIGDLIGRRAACIPGRRIALLDDGDLALVSEQARVEDHICAFQRANVFFAVRKLEEEAQSMPSDQRVLADFEGRISAVGHYTLIGECWKGMFESMRKETNAFDMGFVLH
ncbi:Heterokaryon incompatibility protein (HET) domain containing protein [Hyaloscypha variabilis]